ncbi:N-acetyltransferase [Adhaeribacter aerolatus]|uniref:N-acetyltransferase n=1 Tax=Adhaeribacter aerolatus TaxID=670289 RepID=A0A512B636_9BACT|nr:GNAT family protein [Adhaeribacter aerolatus]GEO07425.1 N-acetyltransferase [Adhaeribacter aerolatus]
MFRTNSYLASDFPALTTNRLVLRQILPTDQMQVYQGLSHPEVVRYYGVEYHSYPDTSEQMKWYQQLYKNNTGLWWGITLPEQNELIGACGYYNLQAQHRKAELGYWLIPQFWRQGLMQEALQKIIPYGLQELNLHRIEAYVETENQASGQLLQGLGFQHEGLLRDTEIKQGRFISLNIFALLNTQ